MVYEEVYTAANSTWHSATYKPSHTDKSVI